MSLSGTQAGTLQSNQDAQFSETASSEQTAQAEAPVAPAQMENQPAEVQPENVRAAVYNGGRINGLAQKIAELVMLMPGITVSEKTNAVGSYKKTTVIDLSGSLQELAQKIAEALGGEVAVLPEGETKPAADILIIGGSNFNKQSL